MSNTAIKVENLSKIYRLGEIGTGTISRDMERWFKTKILKQEDPFLKIGETNDRANKGFSDIVYSLRDINFEIQQGDAVGIIGRNGAGKSTLLKILSRVTTPTTGKIKIKGRIASLLEVGTGFHPELTGRENIYLNGAILGMRKREIDRKLDEIIDFSGVERYIDTPVKRYSSGMYVRLAFAVAAHLESEILIVDEVLAVGDADFQKRCLGKMGEVSQNEGRTVLFVSHNMAAIKGLCNTTLLLDNGYTSFIGSTSMAINRYLKGNIIDARSINFFNNTSSDGLVKLNSINVIGNDNNLNLELSSKDEILVSVEYELIEKIYNLRVAIVLSNSEGIEIFSSSDYNYQDSSKIRNRGKYISSCTIPNFFLNIGSYVLKIDIDIPLEKPLIMEQSISFDIHDLSENFLGKTIALRPTGIIHPKLVWKIDYEKISN
jgi:lipopolysaccharide transport system ATP-binding protein